MNKNNTNTLQKLMGESCEEGGPLPSHNIPVDTERGVIQYQVQFKNLFQIILKPFNYIQ
jgi:hypothetical protein